MKRDTIAKLACAYSGLVWGLFWIPLRALEHAGITGLWATLLFYLVPAALTLPLLFWRWRAIMSGAAALQAIGITSALGLVFYSVAMLYTDIVRAMLLFYLTPLWSTLLARIFLGEAITVPRWISMAFAFLGMLVIFHIDDGLPVPRNVGDWLAITSGLLWSVSSVLMRADRNAVPVDLFSLNFLWSAIIGVAIVILFGASQDPSPPLETYLRQLPWLVPVIIVVVMSGAYASMWGTPKLNPGLVGLLFMTEISVGAVTAGIWSGDPFGAREVIGILLITGAGILESIVELIRGRRSARPA
ncbi:DMT family transporter [soil metagenome]